MSFSSVNFIFLFLPALLLVYFLTPRAWRNWPLLLGSLVFYAYGVANRPWMLALLAGSVLLVFLTAPLTAPGRRGRRFCLTALLTLLFGSLLLFKYAGLFLGGQWALPLAISFYTFQLAAYVLDVFWGRYPAERSLSCFATGMLMFPKLISGPLAPYGELRLQLRCRGYSPLGFDRGLRDFVLGLSLKVLLADRIGGLWSQVRVIGFESLSAPLAWLGLAAFSLQLYFDFYGYSLMAMGLGRMLGFSLPDNFLHPYGSRSMTEFWRRWHVTLGRWFRDYIYIPLGGNRCGKGRQIFNLLAVWLLTGLWHGSTVNFLLWGLFLFGLIALEKQGWKKILDRSFILCRVYMLLAIPLSWLLFAVSDPAQIGVYAARLFSGAASHSDLVFYLGQYGWMLGVGLLLSLPGPARLWQRLRCTGWGTALLFILFWLSVYFLVTAGSDPFMYFNF